MKFLSTKEAAALWGISERRVLTLCTGDRIDGAMRVGKVWIIPEGLDKPKDARLRQKHSDELDTQQMDAPAMSDCQKMPMAIDEGSPLQMLRLHADDVS